MKIFHLYILLLFLGFSRVYCQNSTLSNKNDEEQQSCTELYREIKKSDCGKAIYYWLDGVAVEVGLALSVPNLDLNDKEDDRNFSTQTGGTAILPAITLWFPHNYFDNSSFGYKWNFGYFYEFGYYQNLTRDGKEQTKDINTYFQAINIFLTPSLIYDFGKSNDAEQPYWFSTSLGIGLGVGKIKGITYLTEDESDTQCYEAGTDYLAGNLEAADLRERCSVIRYDDLGLGISAGIQLEARYQSWILYLHVNSVGINNSNYFFTSLKTSLTLSYLIEL